MKKKKPPCMRGLKIFEKTGCPQKVWDDEEGCPCWIELSASTRGEPLKKEIRKQCLDLWLWEFQWATMGLLEGNQQAVESFRNGMLQTGEDGKDYPKPDPATTLLLKIIQDTQQRQQMIDR